MSGLSWLKGQDEGSIVLKDITLRNEELGFPFTVTIKGVQKRVVQGKETLLDQHSIGNMVEEMMRSIKVNKTKYNPLPKSVDVVISHRENQTAEESDRREEKQDDYIESYDPRWSFNSVYLDDSAEKQILTALTISKHKEKLFKDWKINAGANRRAIVFNFYGPPGTGKSMTAEAIADYLGKKVYSVNYAQLESKYVGETPKNIRKVFERAAQDQAVLIFDEADSFLGKRLTNVSQSADYGVNITRSVMLLELERFDGVVVFTTNLVANYDEAFQRRILASVEFSLPDEDGRKAIWEVHLPKEMPVSPEVTCECLAKKYHSISGADIKDITLYAAVGCLQKEKEVVCLEDFDNAYKYVINRYSTGEKLTIKHEVITAEQYEREMKELHLTQE